LDFTSFFTMAFLGAAHFFYSWAVFGLDFTSFCTYMLQAAILPSVDIVTCPFFVYTGKYGVLYMCIMSTY